MCTAIVTFLDESGEVCRGELVSPFRIQDNLLVLMGKSGDPLSYAVIEGRDGEYLRMSQVEAHQIQGIEPVCI